MYCPKCSQEQFSDSVRFCSRCGFQLEGVSQLLANDGVIQTSGTESQENLSLYRQITSRVGAKIIFLSLVLLPFAFLLGISADSPEFLIVPLIIFIIGFAQIAYAQIFGKKLLSETRKTQPDYLKPSESRLNLPPTQGTNIQIIDIKRGDTAKISPPSVTEQTTNLLEFKDDK